MIISGTFKDFNNDTITVTIVNDGAGNGTITIGSNNLYFAGDPVQITSNIDDTFEHIIKKSATINLVTQNYVGSYFFANNARDVSVQIQRNNDIIFSGYLEPNTFSQGFSKRLEEFTLNCTDYLSTLQYINYGNTNINNYDAHKAIATNKTFYDILDEMFQDAESGKKIYYDLSKGLDNTSMATLFEDISLNENYIYGEEFDDVYTQDELLHQMLQYLNLHIIQEGKDFYIFDWNTIKNERSNWIDILTGTTQTIPTNHITLLKSHHADADTNLTVADVFSQVQVKCELENQEIVIESPLDKNQLSSYYSNRFHYMTEYISRDSKSNFEHMVENNELQGAHSSIIDWYVQPLYNRNWKLNTVDGVIDDEVAYDNNNEAINGYSLPLYAHQHQITPVLLKFGSVKTKDSTDNTPTPTMQMKDYLYITINGNADNTEAGCSPSEQTIEDRQPIVEYVGNNGGGVYSPADDETTNYIVFSGKMILQPLQWECDRYNNFMMRIASNAPFTTALSGGGQYVYLNVVGDDGYRYYIRKFYQNTYPNQTLDTVLNGTNIQPPTDDMSFKFVGDKYGSSDFKYEWSANGDGTDLFAKLPILECELIIGNKRLVEYNMDEYGNSDFQWCPINGGVTETYVDENGQTQTYLKQTFSIGVNPKINDIILGNEFDIQNTVSWKMNIDAEGMAIPIKKSDNLSGAVIFKILGPINTVWNDITRRHPSFWRHTKWYDSNKFILAHLENIIISNFEAKIYTDGAGTTSTNDNNDLIYMSNENNDYINKKDDITFKLITQLTSREAQEKGISPNICMNSIIDASSNAPITSLYNATTQETAKAEEHYVDQYYVEYSQPKIIMQTTLHDSSDIDFRNIYVSTALGKNFYVQGISENVRSATKTITLKEI